MRMNAYFAIAPLLVALTRAKSTGSTISVFTDQKCAVARSIASQTGTDDGNCNQIPGDSTFSVQVSNLDAGCTISIYTDSFCSINPTAARLDECVSISGKEIGSFSVDGCNVIVSSLPVISTVASTVFVVSASTLTVDSSVPVTVPASTVTVAQSSASSAASSISSANSASAVSSVSTVGPASAALSSGVSISSSLSAALISSLASIESAKPSSLRSAITATTTFGTQVIVVTYIPITATASSPASTSTLTPVPGGSKSHAGAIAGGVVGGVVLLASIGALIFWAKRRKRAEPAHELPAPTRERKKFVELPVPPPPPPVELDANAHQSPVGKSHELVA